MNKLIVVLLVMTAISTQAANAGAALKSDTSGVANLAGLTNNRYFKQGIQAKASGLTMLTISISSEPIQTLPTRINEAHLGLGLSGWQMVSQSAIYSNGNTTHILLSYVRQTSFNGKTL